MPLSGTRSRLNNPPFGKTAEAAARMFWRGVCAERARLQRNKLEMLVFSDDPLEVLEASLCADKIADLERWIAEA